MTSDSVHDSLEQIKTEIERFVSACPNAILFEDGAELMDLSAAEWRLTVAHGKLLFEAWNGARSIVRRVEEVAYRDSGKLGLFVRKDLGRSASVLEMRERGAAAQSRGDARAILRSEITAYLTRQFPGWRLERVTNRSDRERSFSAWYTRGLARRGRTAWAFAAMDAAESPAAADAALAYGLNWLDWLRENARDYAVSGLKLFLPPPAIPVTALRAAQLDPATGLEIFAWPQIGPPEPVRAGEFANTETHLIPRRDAGAWIDRNRDLLVHWFGASLGRLDAVADPAANALSFRVFGLELARMEGQLAPRLLWGLEGNRRIYREEEREQFREFVERVLSERAAAGSSRGEIYRLQPERWLESLLLRDLSKIDPALLAGAYPQVPAFSGAFRGVVDILGISREGRLAVIELKLDEDVTLPLQGLDYWIRVNWLNERGQFHPAGYFSNMAISPLPPVLYLVSPAFRFHPSNERIVRYFRPSIEVIEVGLNQQWREGVKVLFRKERNSAPHAVSQASGHD